MTAITPAAEHCRGRLQPLGESGGNGNRAPTGMSWPSTRRSASAVRPSSAVQGDLGRSRERRRRASATRISFQPSGASFDDSEREVVGQFVGDHHSRWPGRPGSSARAVTIGPEPRMATGSSSGSGGTAGPRTSSAGSSGRLLGLGGPKSGRPLDEDVAEGAGAAGFGPEDVAGELTPTGAGVDDEERVGLAQLIPPPVHRPGDQGAEQRADFDAGEEVAAGPAPLPRPGRRSRRPGRRGRRPSTRRMGAGPDGGSVPPAGRPDRDSAGIYRPFVASSPRRAKRLG